MAMTKANKKKKAMARKRPQQGTNNGRSNKKTREDREEVEVDEDEEVDKKEEEEDEDGDDGEQEDDDDDDDKDDDDDTSASESGFNMGQNTAPQKKNGRVGGKKVDRNTKRDLSTMVGNLSSELSDKTSECNQYKDMYEKLKAMTQQQNTSEVRSQARNAMSSGSSVGLDRSRKLDETKEDGGDVVPRDEREFQLTTSQVDNLKKIMKKETISWI
jgi:hypothetical protein